MTEKSANSKIEILIEDAKKFLNQGSEHASQMKEIIKMISALQEKVSAYGGDWNKLIEAGNYSAEKKKEITNLMKNFNEEAQKLFKEQAQANAVKTAEKKFSQSKPRSFQL